MYAVDAEEASYESSTLPKSNGVRHTRAGAYENRSMCIGLSLKTDNNGNVRMDENLFNQFYAQHKPSIYVLCIRMLGNAQAAEEATQNTFTKMFFKYHKFRDESELTTWLYRIAMNECLQELRKKPRWECSIYTESESGIEREIPEASVPGDLPLLNLELRDIKKSLNEAMNGLPKGYRIILLLHDLEEYDHKEIAHMLGCSIGTSKSQLVKARKKMRMLLETYENMAEEFAPNR